MNKKLIFLSSFLLLSFLFLSLKDKSVKNSYASCSLCPGPLCNVNLCPPLPSLPPIIPTCPVTPTPTPDPGLPTSTPMPEVTPTVIPGGPTNTPAPQGGTEIKIRPDHNTCYYQCDSDFDCHAGQDCQDEGGGRKICRNPNCTKETTCECPGQGGAVLGEGTTQIGQVLGLAYTGQFFNNIDTLGRVLIILGLCLLI